MMTISPAPAAAGRSAAATSKPVGRVAVIGGGIAGLAAAHFLARAGADVVLYESTESFGGLGGSFRYRGRELDRFYHVLLPTDQDLLALCDDLGVGDRVYWRHASLGFLFRRRLYPLRGPLDLLRFGAVPFHDRVRLGATALYASTLARPDRLDDITVEEWLGRLSGRRAFDRLWRPLLEAKFGDAWRQIPALWYWASFRREKGTGKEVKGSLRGGYHGLTESLVAALRSRGAQLRTGTPVARLDLGPDGRPCITAAGATDVFDHVVATVPFGPLRAMSAGGAVGDALAAIDHPIDYQGVVNVLVLLDRPLTDHYWIPVVDSGVPFQGIVETTRVLDLADTGGFHLVYLMNYVHRDAPLYSRPADSVRDEYVAALIELFPDLAPADVVGAFVFRAPFVEPLYTPGYGARKPPMELVPGRVFLATTTQVYPRVTSWNSSIGLAAAVVEQVVHAAGER